MDDDKKEYVMPEMRKMEKSIKFMEAYGSSDKKIKEMLLADTRPVTPTGGSVVSVSTPVRREKGSSYLLSKNSRYSLANLCEDKDKKIERLIKEDDRMTLELLRCKNMPWELQEEIRRWRKQSFVLNPEGLTLNDKEWVDEENVQNPDTGYNKRMFTIINGARMDAVYAKDDDLEEMLAEAEGIITERLGRK